MSERLSRRLGGSSVVLALALTAGAAAEGPPGQDLVATGRRLYREGRLASGEAVSALVQGDVPVLGTQVTCESCHGRSGFGVIESGRISPPLSGPLLFSPDAGRRRPAYSEKTLARALREGVDPLGRPLDPLMPRFLLGDADVAALEAYLRTLGAAASPGVGPSSLRLATVVAGEVASGTELAVLDVLRAFVSDRNRSGPQRRRGGHAPGEPKETFREWTLDVWRLTGPPAEWRARLESLYRERPPFALVGGIGSGSWQPIHDFCEAERIPCLLPDTDLPPGEDGGYYTWYFSRGLTLEAEILAARLADSGLGGDVVAVVEGGGKSPSAEASAAFARALARRGGRSTTREARGVRGPDTDANRASGDRVRVSAIVLWLEEDGVRRVAANLPTRSATTPVFVSSTLLRGRWDDVPESLRARAQTVHLTRLPGEADSALERFRGWARSRGVRIREERHQALAYFSCLAFADGVKHLGRFLLRDYFMDLLEHASALAAYLPLYPRAGITPGQRVLSRGGYVVDLSGRSEPVWVVP